MSFEIMNRAGAGRIGRFEANHGRVTTPTLMPVINPNIGLVSAKEMQELFGAQMVITNSYVIHKHAHLREHALEKGVHDLIDFDGTIMTDSGTFQMYVYGDVQVGPEEIVQFQRDMGVDVATCLDLFVTPDMTREQAEEAVATTLQRTKDAVPHRGSSLINATVQGGIHLDLRQKCAQTYRNLDVGYHTIGGVVPVMERQMYPELVRMILASQAHLRKDRPVHLFGAGHPLVFPIATALGCDLFDSSSYAKYAKDGRIMTPEGTIKLDDIEEFPFESRFVQGYTVQELRKASAKERTRQLALHNLDVCFTDIRRIREAIRNGSLWELVEQRAACHPLLQVATRQLGEAGYQAWLEEREPLSSHRGLRYTGPLTHQRPLFHRIQDRMATRMEPTGQPVEIGFETPYAEQGEERVEVALHKPGGSSLQGGLDSAQEHAVVTAFGAVPLGLLESYPFGQSMVPDLQGLDPAHMGWVGQTKDAYVEAHGLVPALPNPPGPEPLDRDRILVQHTMDFQFGPGLAKRILEGPWRLERSKSTGRARGVYWGDELLASFRIHDGFWSLKMGAAKLLHEVTGGYRVVVTEESATFNRQGRNVFAQFIVSMTPDVRPLDEVLVVDANDTLLATGQSLLNAEEAMDFQNGMAVKVRDGIDR